MAGRLYNNVDDRDHLVKSEGYWIHCKKDFAFAVYPKNTMQDSVVLQYGVASVARKATGMPTALSNCKDKKRNKEWMLKAYLCVLWGRREGDVHLRWIRPFLV